MKLAGDGSLHRGNLVEAVSEAAGTYQAAYDGFGRRVWERVDRLTGETQTYFVYDSDTLVAALDANGNPIAEYSWGLLGPIARHDLQNPANNRYYVLDALGHTRALLDNQGSITDTYVYDAWGNLLKGSEWYTPNPFTWNGAYGYQWIEFTGLYHIGAREYDPRVGRWLQRDPIGIGGGHPNVYLYCANEPVNAKDPSGLQPALTSPDTPHGRATIIQMALEEAKQSGWLLRNTQWWGYVVRCYEKHHVFPKMFSRDFGRVFRLQGRQLDEFINRFTLRIPDWFHDYLGRGAGGWWQREWETFFRTNPNASPLQVWRFLRQLLDRCGLRDVKFREFVPYR